MATATEAILAQPRKDDIEFQFLKARNKELNAKAIELALENERLKSRPAAGQVVYRETETTRKKLEIDAETIRQQVVQLKGKSCVIDRLLDQIIQLRQDVAHHSDASGGQMSTSDEQDERLDGLTSRVGSLEAIAEGVKTEKRSLSNLLLSATARISDLTTETAHLRDEAEEQVATIQERDDTIKGHRETIRGMTVMIDDLVPECEHCVDGEAICPLCKGTASADPRRDDFGHRFSCQNPACNHGSVKCSECEAGAGS